MNKITILPALAAVCALSLTSCKDDTQPRLQDPTPGTFKVYEPAMNNYVYYLDPESTIDLVTSQPNYGLGLVTQYEVQVALTDEFKDAVLEEGVDTDGNPVVTEKTPATYQVLPTVGHQAQIKINGNEMAIAICSMLGIKDENDLNLWTPAISGVREVYVRVRAFIPDPKEKNGEAAGSSILSNVVKLNQVQPYLAINVPAKIYLIGSPQGWDVAKGTMPIDEAEAGIGSDIYSGVYQIENGALFRFYKELGDWGNDGALPSIGSGPEDNTKVVAQMDVEDNPGLFEGDCTPGKGSWEIAGWDGSWLKLTVNLVNNTVSFQATEAPAAE